MAHGPYNYLWMIIDICSYKYKDWVVDLYAEQDGYGQAEEVGHMNY